MKLIDKFLKKLNVSRNTFATYILTLITAYIAIDRIVEMLLMIFTGVASSYWGPIRYTFAIAAAVFAFAFSGTSSFSDTRAQRVSLFYLFATGLYIIVISMFTQTINMLAWLLFMSSPNYVTIVTNFSEVIRPAFCAISLYLPITTAYPFAKWIFIKLDDTSTIKKSLWDYKGISLSNKKEKHGPYACDLKLFKDFDDGKQISFHEKRRFQSLLVCGASGSGKTAMIFEPAIAQDIEKKYFFKEASKELGFTALKTKIATLTSPYSNEYLNNNFSLNMLSPVFGKEHLFDTFLKKMILSSNPRVYKDIGITYMSPDVETINNMCTVCDNFGIKYSLLDPSRTSNSIGLNPFVYDDPARIATIVSSTIQATIPTDGEYEKRVYPEEAALQILENLAILLKLIYPKMNGGVLPNLEDMLKLLLNYELIEKMCKILEKDEELAKQYEMLLGYFKRNFYSDGNGKKQTEENTYIVANRLENLLRSPNIRSILCDRTNNVNFDYALQNGEVIFICTRRGESGKIAHKAFGMFFLLSMQNAVLSRSGDENSRIPNFLYIDEFPEFLNKDTETIFTMYRKYKVGTSISAQSISQISSNQREYDNTILSNFGSKIYTGGATENELEWWAKELGKWKEWKFDQDFDNKTGEMSKTLKNPKYDYTIKMSANRLQNLPQNGCGYRIELDNGSWDRGQGIMYYLSSKYKEKHSGKVYDFEKYYNTAKASNDNRRNFLNNNDNDSFEEEDPIKNKPKKYIFDDENIVIDLKNEAN